MVCVRAIISVALIAVVSVVVGAGITSWFGSASHAGVGVATDPGGLAVLTEGTAKRASASSLKKGIPPEAVLAGVYGRSEIYVSRRLAAGGAVDLMTHGYDLCLTTTEPGGLGGTACSPSSRVEEEGLVTVRTTAGRVHVEALLPNGVQSVTVIDSRGARHLVATKNNVAVIEDANVTAVRYMLSTGNVHTEYIPAGFVERRADKLRSSPT